MAARFAEPRASRAPSSGACATVGIVMRVLPRRSAFVAGYDDGFLAYFDVRESEDMPAVGDRISCANVHEATDATNHTRAGSLIRIFRVILRLPPIAALALAE